MRIAVVGSRDFPDPRQVAEFIWSLPYDTTIVSGGGGIVDLTAEEAARKRRLSRTIFEPQCPRGAPRYRYIAALFARNILIARECDAMCAFQWKSSTGTAHAIEACRSLGKLYDVRGPR